VGPRSALALHLGSRAPAGLPPLSQTHREPKAAAEPMAAVQPAGHSFAKQALLHIEEK
jgi:hypothetical protein